MLLRKTVLCLAVILAANAYAFDTKTHVYIGQEVINDLDDGELTIEPFGEFDVDREIVKSILRNKSTYLMGNVGPDGFPDVVGGQVTTHPGLENGWKTDDWLKWIIDAADSRNEIAFAYGYLSHAAADTFAHTYVNWYTGDAFSLSDGEIDVELRHKFLEGFIAKYQPDLTNHKGNPLNKLPHEVVADENDLPIEFINSTLLMNSRVANEYSNSGTARYLYRMYKTRETLLNINGTLNDSIKQWEDFGESQNDEVADVQKEIVKKLETMEETSNDWISAIDTATKEYIEMSARAAKYMLQPVPDVSAVKSDLEDWISCHGVVFGGALYQGSKSSCLEENVTEDITDLIESFNQLSNFQRNLISVFGGSQTLEVMLGIEQTLKGELDGMAALLDTLDTEIREEINTFDEDPNTTALNTQFSIDNTSKHLLIIPNIADRVQAEMHLDAQGKFDPKKYNVIYNAIVLSKLSLLSPDELNKLAKVAGLSHSTVYAGSPLYDNNGPENILFSSIKSIDGNHQWMHEARRTLDQYLTAAYLCFHMVTVKMMALGVFDCGVSLKLVKKYF